MKGSLFATDPHTTCASVQPATRKKVAVLLQHSVHRTFGCGLEIDTAIRRNKKIFFCKPKETQLLCNLTMGLAKATSFGISMVENHGSKSSPFR